MGRTIKIRRIEIFNYRSCIKTKVDILTDLTTLIGCNGVGKSNILNSLQLLQKINRNRYFHQSSIIESLSNSRLELLLVIDGELYLLRADLYYDTNEANMEQIYSAELKIKKKKVGHKWIELDVELFEYLDYIVRSGSKLKLDQVRYGHYKNVEELNFAIEILMYLRNISNYSATQFSDPTKCPISLELEDSRLTKSYRRFRTHEQFMYDLYIAYTTDKNEFKKYVNTVNANGIGLVDDISFYDYKIPTSSLKVKAGGQVEKIEKIKNIVVPSIIIDNLNLSPNQLSEGTFKTLALVFYILNDDSNLLLIEEPEVCVHHGLLNSIIELIKIQSNFKQIIISTHSDFVLDKLEPENVVLVDKNRNKGTIAKSLFKTLSKNEFQALKDYLENSGNLGEYWKEGGFEDE